jgi:hypothetical protein
VLLPPRVSSSEPALLCTAKLKKRDNIQRRHGLHDGAIISCPKHLFWNDNNSVNGGATAKDKGDKSKGDKSKDKSPPSSAPPPPVVDVDVDPRAAMMAMFAVRQPPQMVHKETRRQSRSQTYRHRPRYRYRYRYRIREPP